MDSEKEQKKSLDYAIARDKLIRQGVLPDDPIVKADDAYWEQFNDFVNGRQAWKSTYFNGWMDRACRPFLRYRSDH